MKADRWSLVLAPEADNAEHTESRGKRTAALIAADTSSSAIVELLAANGIEAAAFSRIEEALDRENADLAIVVLCVKDDPRSLARTVSSLVQRFEQIPLVLVCDGVHAWGIRTALANGAAGVVLHDELNTTFGPCLRAVLSGLICVPRAHGRNLDPPSLSSREKQILGLVVMGYMNRQIAAQLFLAESTVKSHLSSAFGKLGVRSRHEAVNLIVNPDSGLGLGILGLGGEPVGSFDESFDAVRS